MAEIAAPTNWLTSLANTIIDGAILNVGEDVLYAQAIAAQPWLASPFVSWLLKQVISWVCSRIDVGLKKNADAIIVRLQNDAAQAKYEADLKAGVPRDKINSDIDSLVRRGSRL